MRGLAWMVCESKSVAEERLVFPEKFSSTKKIQLSRATSLVRAYLLDLSVPAPASKLLSLRDVLAVFRRLERAYAPAVTL